MCNYRDEGDCGGWVRLSRLSSFMPTQYCKTTWRDDMMRRYNSLFGLYNRDEKQQQHQHKHNDKQNTHLVCIAVEKMSVLSGQPSGYALGNSKKFSFIIILYFFKTNRNNNTEDFADVFSFLFYCVHAIMSGQHILFDTFQTAHIMCTLKTNCLCPPP